MPIAILTVVVIATAAEWYVWSTLSAIRSGLPLEILAFERDVGVYHQDVRHLERALEVAATAPSGERTGRLKEAVEVAAIRLRNMDNVPRREHAGRFDRINAALTVLIDDINYGLTATPADRAGLVRLQRRAGDLVLDLKELYDETMQRSMSSLSAQRSALDRFSVSLVILLLLIAASACAVVVLLLKMQGAMAVLEASQRDRDRYIAEIEDTQSRLQEQSAELIGASEKIRAARDAAEAANKAKSAFLANMSHELRTPLNAIIGFSEIIRHDALGPVGNSRYQEYARDINDSGLHLLDLVTDILDLSKIESGTAELYEEIIEIHEIVASVLTLIRDRANTGGVRVNTCQAPTLPPMRADRRKLKQILVNLLSNAIKFTESGGEVTLRIWTDAHEGYVFQVADTGIGMAADDIPKALSPFGQVGGDLDRRYEGTGLGLPLTKSLAELHGGSIDLQSEAGAGTTITVRFPADRIVAASASARLGA